MTKSEQIAQILGIPSTDVIVTNDSEARLKDRELTEAEKELIADVFLSEDKKQIKALKAENKLLKDRIAGATDFNDLKAKIVKVKDSEDNPTKWSDKVVFLEGEKIEHKGLFYISLSDHTADKAKEPPNAPELYRPA